MKTAVEFLFEEMNRIRLEYECGNIGAINFFRLQRETIKKAKEMERKQILDSIELAHKTDYNSDFTCKYTKEYIIDIILNNNKSEGKDI